MACVALRRRIGLLSVMTALTVPVAAHPTAAAPAGAEASVELSRLTPSVLTPGADLTIRGVVRNEGRQRLAGALAYVTIPTDPFVNHRAARNAILQKTVDRGHQIADSDAVHDLGAIKPGESRRFTLKVPYESFGFSGAEGVYPVSVHLRARGGESVGHATTFLPLRPEAAGRPVPTTVVWPFLRPAAGLPSAIGPGGQLRHLLDLARAAPRRGSDILIDPALVSQARAIATGKPTQAVPEEARAAAQNFAADLVRLANDRECWSTGFDQPDPVALKAATVELRDLVSRATRGTLRAYGLRCSRLEWPASAAASRTVLASMGTDTVIVDGAAVPNWQSVSGPLLRAADHDLVVNDRLDAGVGHRQTPLTLRQRILSEATWAAMAKAAGGRNPTVVVVDPRWDPGRGGKAHLKVALDNKYVLPIGLDEQLESGAATYNGALPARGTASVSPAQIAEATEAAQLQKQLRRVLVERSANLGHDQQIASSVSQRWQVRQGGEEYARDVNDRLHDELSDISIEGPAALTLSSSKGRFPVTISNRTGHQVSVGTVISSTNPAVAIEIPRGSVIAAGESRTLTASIDMDGQSVTTVTINLTTGDGTILGAPSVFNVRSSRVGAALWVAIGLSVAFVALALIRRFARPGHRPEHASLPPDDFDD